MYDKKGAGHWATQDPCAAARGAARGAAGARSRAFALAGASLGESNGVAMGGDPRALVGDAREARFVAISSRRRAGASVLRFRAPRAARRGTRRDSSDVPTGSSTTSWLM